MHQRARTDLRGGRGETRVPTATFGNGRLVLVIARIRDQAILRPCNLPATRSLCSHANSGCAATILGNVVNDGRLLSLQAAEWLMLIAGGVAGLLILMF